MISPRIRLLFVITDLQTGGAEAMLYKLLSRLDRQRFDAAVICLKAGGAMEPAFRKLGIEVHVIGFSPSRPSPAAFLRGLSLVRQLKPDLIQGWMYHANLVARLWAWAARAPVPVLWGVRASVYQRHEVKLASWMVMKVCGWLSRWTAGVIYCSEVARRQHELTGYLPERSLFIPNGFDCELFQPLFERHSELCALLQIQVERRIVALIGRYDPQKDHRTFLQAAARVADQIPSAYFVLIGSGVDPTNEVLRHQIDELGLQDRVRLLGERSDIAYLLPGVDLLVSSSNTGEGFPNVIGEAMACAVPCVVTDVGDSSLVVGDPSLVVPPRLAPELAEVMIRVLQLPDGERRALGRRARERVLAEYDVGAITRRYEDVFERVLGPKCNKV